MTDYLHVLKTQLSKITSFCRAHRKEVKSVAIYKTMNTSQTNVRQPANVFFAVGN